MFSGRRSASADSSLRPAATTLLRGLAVVYLTALLYLTWLMIELPIELVCCPGHPYIKMVVSTIWFFLCTAVGNCYYPIAAAAWIESWKPATPRRRNPVVACARVRGRALAGLRYIEFQQGPLRVPGLLDTGAEMNAVGSRLLRRLPHVVVKGPATTVEGFSGAPAPVRRWVEVSITVQRYPLRLVAAEFKELGDSFMFGMPFVTAY